MGQRTVEQTVKVVEKDTGFKRAVARATSLGGKGAYVEVGIFEGAMTEAQAEGGGPTPIAVYAAVHEFGSTDGTQSEKAWMRSPLDANKGKYQKVLDEAWLEILLGQRTVEQVLTELGLMIQADLKKSITRVKWTNIQGEDQTGIIDTGAMRNSVVYELQLKGRP